MIFRESSCILCKIQPMVKLGNAFNIVVRADMKTCIIITLLLFLYPAVKNYKRITAYINILNFEGNRCLYFCLGFNAPKDLTYVFCCLISSTTYLIVFRYSFLRGWRFEFGPGLYTIPDDLWGTTGNFVQRKSDSFLEITQKPPTGCYAVTAYFSFPIISKSA